MTTSRKSQPHKIPCEWNGVQYPSIKAAADANFITQPGMWVRIRRNGYKCDEDMKNLKGRAR